jgi:hypothetical protein
MHSKIYVWKGNKVTTATSEKDNRSAIKEKRSFFDFVSEMDKVWKAAIMVGGILVMGRAADAYFATNTNLERTGNNLGKEIKTSESKMHLSNGQLQMELKRSECRLLDGIALINIESDRKLARAEQIRRQSAKANLLQLRKDSPIAFDKSFGSEQLAEITREIAQADSELALYERKAVEMNERRSRQSCNKVTE